MGGGLLEAELQVLATALVKHAEHNVEVGPLVFELVTAAEEKATLLVSSRIQTPVKIEAVADQSKAQEPEPTEEEQAAANAKKDAVHAARIRSNQARLAAIRAGESIPTGSRVDAGASTAKPALTEAPKQESFDGLFEGSTGVDKGGYVSKKKKK